MKRSFFIGPLIACSFTVPLAAETNRVETPDGCTPVATVMKTVCQATTVFRCANSIESHTYQNGEHAVIHEYQPNWDMVGFRFAGFAGASMTAIAGSRDDTNLNELIKTGQTEENGKFVMNTRMIKDRPYVLSGQVSLSEDVAEFGGAAFRTGSIKRLFEREPGAGGMAFEVDIYVSEDPDLFIEGSWTRSVFGSETEMFDQTPYAIAWPGEDGFLATMPDQGCE